MEPVKPGMLVVSDEWCSRELVLQMVRDIDRCVRTINREINILCVCICLSRLSRERDLGGDSHNDGSRVTIESLHK